ncbi:hypothetical protein [Microbacterium sp. J1-1]|uniref:hypothetical protein n=1 Tax=Microbacterium sp. J1-1 TaxID=2992441 RepID=UPI0021139BAD|nr:hypothetical protein [Microbacterium sp. J1-1]UUE19312.1 hypothetical protein LRQ07_10875 [Microbacterium sp. J1-1]
MPSRGLHPDVTLGIAISCVMSRNRYTRDPAPVIDELYATAGGRLDLLTREVGRWIGFYEDDYVRALATALRALPLDMADEIEIGRKRRFSGTRGTHGYARPPGVRSP